MTRSTRLIRSTQATQPETRDDNDDGNYFRVKLRCRITKKDVSIELETKATMKKLSLKPPKEKNQKRWWRR
ncbi:hypothetical protein LIER_16392 [Lithospermum erythrorhizon]|uniref:Uncharacterized protein n=1 Tax=Lithospermum erythrorhizon TaxID=34254 RepID=A0AAV3QBV4_LITER